MTTHPSHDPREATRWALLMLLGPDPEDAIRARDLLESIRAHERERLAGGDIFVVNDRNSECGGLAAHINGIGSFTVLVNPSDPRCVFGIG